MTVTLATETAAPETANRPLYMVQLPVDGRRLFTFARDQGLLGADTGYVIHALLAALLGPDAPRPFALPADKFGVGLGDPAIMPVLAYGHRPACQLQDIAQTIALPAVYQAVRWDDAGVKPMPARFPAGLRLGFEVRACPVVRLGRGNLHRTHGSEVDALVAAYQAAEDGRVPVPESRETVYRSWLAERLAATDGVVPHQVEILAMRSVRLFRRGARSDTKTAIGRPSAWLQRPDVRFRGTLEVTNPEAFARWLLRGVGRHRAFGFGMVLLRPV
ncbi:MAG: type I-E CRISPR-associated protein Cas6/Cse3/CasE [Rhodospirillaceae bacterium]